MKRLDKSCLKTKIFFFSAIHGLILHDIEVPEMVKIDTEEDEPIKLDCEYELINNPSYLVVKWFMNDNNIYQWIRGQQPSVLVSVYKNRMKTFLKPSEFESFENNKIFLSLPVENKLQFIFNDVYIRHILTICSLSFSPILNIILEI